MTETLEEDILCSIHFSNAIDENLTTQEYKFDPAVALDDPLDEIMMEDEENDILFELFNHDNTTVIHEISNDIEVSEEDKVKKFVSDTCGCKYAEGNPCSSLFTKADIFKFRLQSSALDYYEENVNKLDVVIMSLVRALCAVSGKTRSSHQKNQDRVRSRTKFMLNGFIVCERTFLFAHCMSHKRFGRIKRKFLEEGLMEIKHGNAGGMPVNTTPFKRTEHVVTFLRNYANAHALFLPGHVAYNKNISCKLLPTFETKKHVYEVYVESCEQIYQIPLPQSAFNIIWNQHCSEIVIMKPKSDLCGECQRNYVSLGAAACWEEEKKCEVVQNMRNHLDKVAAERKYYNSVIESSRQPQSTFYHFSFDMPQQVSLPSNALQPGPMYFLCPFKVAIFGVMQDSAKVQFNYLIPESVALSKGSNIVTTLLHDVFTQRSVPPSEMHLHAHIKNTTVINYLNYRILKGLNEKIKFSFMPVGHTKFECDRAFGLLKEKYRLDALYTMNDLKQCVENSTPTTRLNQAIIVANEKGEKQVQLLDWNTWFEDQGWKKIPKISMFSHFNFDAAYPGKVRCQQGLNEQFVEYEIGQMHTTSEPTKLSYDKMSYERQRYLFDKIRPYCTETSKDVLCPEPRSKEDDVDMPEEQPQKRTKKTQN